MPKLYLTYGQSVTLVLILSNLDQINWQKMSLMITQPSQFKRKPKHYERINSGYSHTDIAYAFKVPNMKVEETELEHYLSIMIRVDGEVITRALGPAIIMSNERYFEWKVASLLQLMYFRTVRYGMAKPDVVAHHISHPTQIFDVEVTVQKKYDDKKYAYDLWKFQRYTKQHNFKRLLIVSASGNVEKGVIESLVRTKDPITLICYDDIFYLYKQLDHGRMNPDAVYSKLTETGYVKLRKPKFPKPHIIPVEKKKIWVDFPSLFSTKKIKTRKLKMVYIRDTTIDDVGKILSFAHDIKNKYASRQKFHDLSKAHFKQKKGAEALSLSTLHNPQNWDITFIHLGLLDDRMKITADGTELAHYWRKDRSKFRSRLAWLVLVRGNAVELLRLLDKVQKSTYLERSTELKNALVTEMIKEGLCATEGSGRKAVENTLRWIRRFDLIYWDRNMKRYFIYWKKIDELITKGNYIPKSSDRPHV